MKGPELASDHRLLKTVVADQVDVLPEQGGEMRPGVLGDRVVTAGQFLGGGLEIASVPDRESVDDEAERRRSVELRLVAAITETALAAEADLPCHGVQALLAVQSDQHSAPERLVVYVAQDVPGLGHPAELLERLLHRVLPAQCLELGNDQRRSDQPVLERSSKPPDGGDLRSRDAARAARSGAA